MELNKSLKFATVFLILNHLVFGLMAQALPTLKINENRRFLVTSDETPFFWLGDTAWELFHRLDREEATLYLENRASLGYTVIQAVALAELDGHVEPNPYGHLPLEELDPSRPAIKDGPDNDYWDHVDFIVDKANELGMYVAFLPTWGRYWHDNIKEYGDQPLFNPKNAKEFGAFLANRYGEKGIIWVVGGDRTVENDEQKEINRSLALALREGDGGRNLITFHPRGGRSSSEVFHEEEWLDFNMRQNGHAVEFTGRYDQTKEDYDKHPTKPVLDGEPIYEDHPVSFRANELGHSIAYDVRCPLYWNLFQGAFGHTYGHHSVWQMYDPEKGRRPINNPLMPWHEAIHQAGAMQMQFGRRLMESRPFLSRIPDQSILVESGIPSAMPGAGRYKFVATRDEEGTYAMVFAPVGRSFKVDMSIIKGEKVVAWWFNPRNGEVHWLNEFVNKGTRKFISPSPGEFQDWVLVLDDASKGYPPPGRK